MYVPGWYSIQTELKNSFLKWPRIKRITSGSNFMEEVNDEESEVLNESDKDTLESLDTTLHK